MNLFFRPIRRYPALKKTCLRIYMRCFSRTTEGTRVYHAQDKKKCFLAERSLYHGPFVRPFVRSRRDIAHPRGRACALILVNGHGSWTKRVCGMNEIVNIIDRRASVGRLVERSVRPSRQKRTERGARRGTAICMRRDAA